MDDVEWLRESLAEVEEGARLLRWAAERPWRVQSHVRWAGDLPEVDLHDLDARHARDAVRAVAAVRLDTGAVRFVTGRGRHSVGPGGVLGGVVRSELKKLIQQHDWQFRPAGPARWVLLTNREKAPAAATGDLGWGFWILVALFAAAALIALANASGLLQGGF